MKYQWTDDMREISGFGGGYELACRAMVSAGLDWWDKNPTAKPEFQGYKGITGIISENNADAKALTEAILDAEIEENGKKEKVRGNCTGAMHQFSVMHCLQAHRLGWEEYSRLMREARQREALPASQHQP